MGLAKFWMIASTGAGVVTIVFLFALQQYGEWRAEDEAPPQSLIGSPSASRLDSNLPYYGYRMSMGASKVGSLRLDGLAEPARLRARLDARRGRVSLLWTHGEDTSAMFASPKRQLLTYQDVGFPAASIAVMPNGNVVIAGLEEGTRRPAYEVWAFGDPRLVDDDVGKPTLTEPAILSKTRVAAHAEDLNYGVTQAMWTGGALGEERVWIFTYPEADIRELDLRTGRSRMMMSPTNAVGSVAFWEGLDRQWEHAFYWGQHKTCGHCFLLSLAGDVSFEKGKLTSILLMDRNLDGLLDDWTLLFAQQEYPHDLDNQEMWIRD